MNALVADYQAGVPTTRLTTKYNLGKGTVLDLLRGQGVQLRQTPMTPEEQAEAIRLYQQGLSLAAVGTKLGRDDTTILTALKKAGVPRRDPHERRR